MPSSCPVCGGAGPFAFVESWHDPVGGRDYALQRCSACEVVFAEPFEHPGAGWYARFSAGDSYEGSERKSAAWIRSLAFRPGGRLLDVGCGSGHFVAAARAMGYEAEGIDPNPNAVAAAGERGLRVRRGGLLDVKEEGAYDVVTLLDVLEHLDDPRGALERVRALLKPGGGLILSLPNDRRPLPFGRDAFDYPPHHLTRWTPRALERFLAAHGFEVRAARHGDLPSWEFSRKPIGWLTALLLRLVKRALYGRADKTLTELAAEKPSALLPAKSARTGLVMRFQRALGWLLAPVFWPLTLFYRLTRRDCGVSSFVLAVKAAEPS